MNMKKTMASKNAGLGAVLKRKDKIVGTKGRDALKVLSKKDPILNIHAKGRGSDLLNIHAKGKGQNMMKPSKVKGLPRVTKGGWSEYVESFNRPSGAERQSSHYGSNDWWKTK